MFTLAEVLDATDGQLLISGPVREFGAVSTDTRTLQPGDLFVAIRGERFNGHAFLDEAKKKGAAGVLVNEEIPGVRRRHLSMGDWCLIEVTDTTYALGNLARFHRGRFHLPVVGVTGSAGKTTTKELTASILGQRRTVLKTRGNFNNEIGLPFTLFTLSEAHQAAVLEFGMRGPGQISYLASIARPTVGIITNIGLTHLELLGSPQAIALAKAELLDELAADGAAILPGHDDFLPLLLEHAPGTVITFGQDADCDMWAGAIALDEMGCASCIMHYFDEEFPVRIGAPGRHQVLNALAASAAALTVGASVEEVRAGLAGAIEVKGRMQMARAPRGFFVVDDSYNANPAAVRATLEFLTEVPGKRKIAILGDMRELGPREGELHREIGRFAMQQPLDALLAVGELGREYVAGAGDPRANWFPDNAAAAQAALAQLAPGDVVLVKGSRAMAMDEIVALLLAAADAPQ